MTSAEVQEHRKQVAEKLGSSCIEGLLETAHSFSGEDLAFGIKIQVMTSESNDFMIEKPVRSHFKNMSD